MIEIKSLHNLSKAETDAFLSREVILSEKTIETTRKIVDFVKAFGDRALLELASMLEKKKIPELKVPLEKIKNAKKKIPKETLAALKSCARNINAYHSCQKPKEYSIRNNGVITGRSVIPYDSVGVYVPGGRASYPSSVLMGCIPARLAGVKRIIICTPYKEGRDVVFAAADLCGVTEIYNAGGAQAITAMAYGTETVPKVDKIVGPGNPYVCAAKEILSKHVGIEFIAGPSEVLIIADSFANPAFVAMDLLAQCEHAPDAIAVLVTTSQKTAISVKRNLEMLLEESPLEYDPLCSLLVASDIDECIDFTNKFAPEHLELIVKNANQLYKRVRNCPSIFIGNYTPTALGDYCSGTNHVLPTMGLGRFTSGLKVEDFVRYVQYQEASKKSIKKIGPSAITMARAEGLKAHAKSIELRLKD